MLMELEGFRITLGDSTVQAHTVLAVAQLPQQPEPVMSQDDRSE
jgi:hypothetical protein